MAFPGLPNTIGTLLDRSLAILQTFKKSEKWGGPWAPGALDHGSGPHGPGPKQKQRNSETWVFFQHSKDVRRNSVPKTVLNNSKSLIWSHSANFQTNVKFKEIGCMYAATFGCKIYAFWAHVYGAVGCMYAVVGCKVLETFGCKVCGCWVQVCGNGWVQTLRLLGAKSAETFGCMPDSR